MPSNLKKIRDIERMMKKFGETPELQAKLAQAKQGKEKVKLNEKMKKNSTKYHMVKFLERKKVTRMVRSVDSKIKHESDATAKAKLQKNRERLLNDLAYIMYYPIEHKYIALFPSKENLQKDEDDSDDEEQDVEKSKLLSKKAREVALQRWAEDKRLIAEGQTAVLDKVAYAMEVEYKGGVAAAESMPAKAASAKAIADEREAKKGKSASGNAAKGPAGKGAQDKTGAQKPKADKAAAKEADSGASSSGSDSDSSSDSGSSSDSDDSDAPPAKKSKSTEAAKPAPSSAAGASKPTKKAVVEEAKPEDSDDDDKDDFFVEEASESELANNNKTIQPKVYNDGNTFRYKGERQSVHEIRFAATKRKYEAHKRVFNNQNKRNSAQERRK